jgi:hypothetical protein
MRFRGTVKVSVMLEVHSSCIYGKNKYNAQGTSSTRVVRYLFVERALFYSRGSLF